MSIRILLVGTIILAISIFMVITARKKTTALEKYEFENRSLDGEVKFDNLESSRIHAANKGLYKVITVVGFVVGLLGVIILATGVGL
jgi:hypothetical protein